MSRVARALGPVAAGAAVLAVAGVLVQRYRLRWITELTNRIPAHHVYWRERGRAREGSLLYVAIGDSAALGIGATSPRAGYVGILADALAARTGRAVRVRNLAIDGATLHVVLQEELPRLAGLDPDVVTLGIGANDIWTFDPVRFRDEFERICAALPPQTVVSELPSFSVLPVAGRARAANRIIHEVAEAHGFWVAPLYPATGIGGVLDAVLGSAGDLFHPNDRGHARWADAFLPGVLAVVGGRTA
jgi:lysophospholipase L1-like esterase